MSENGSFLWWEIRNEREREISKLLHALTGVSKFFIIGGTSKILGGT
jgi:hypothetical protein